MIRRFMIFREGDAGGGTGAPAAAAPAAAAAPTTLLGGSSQQQAATQEGGSVVATPWSWAKEDGSFNEGWLDKLPADMRGNASLKVLGSLPDLAKSYVETKRLMGTKLEAPGEGATPEAIAAWRKVVGAPDTAAGYGEGKSMRPEGIPENLWSADGEKKFLDIAHKHSLPPAAVKEILAHYGENLQGGLVASQQASEAHLAQEGVALKQAWGKDYDANLHMASRVAQTVGLDPKTHAIFQSAEVVQAFAKLGKLFSEDKLVKGESQGVNGSIAERVRDFTDPKSQSVLSREYRGEFGQERQLAAQAQYHQLLQAQSVR